MKKWLSYAIVCIVIPCLIILGIFLGEQTYAFISMCIMILSCLPFFIRFERRASDTKLLVTVAVTASLTVLGRIIFAAIPGIKPITALVIITAIYFGSETGFMIGSVSAVMSNFYFGQGAWTPFQMFTWGFIGFAAGLLSQPLKKSKILLSIYGFISGIAFSLIMDIWTVLWADGGLNGERYIAAVVSSAPVMAMYAVSNVIFLLVLIKPIGRILDRLKTKYGI